MSTVIKVSAEQMTRDGESIASRVENITNDIGGLADAMKQLASCWEGPAWNAFQNDVSTSIEDMNEICRFFSVYLDELNDAKKVYRKCETENRNRIRNVRV